MEIRDILSLIKSLSELNLSEIELEVEGIKVRLKKEVSVHVPVKEEKEVISRAPAPVGVTIAEKEELRFPPDAVVIRSPIVGTFYRAPSPDSPPYVEIGDIVKKGQTLCIIEAMKIMNEIESEVNGEILDILVENGEPVEYGQPLFLVKPLS